MKQREFQDHARELEVDGRVIQVRIRGGETLNPEISVKAPGKVFMPGILLRAFLGNRNDLSKDIEAEGGGAAKPRSLPATNSYEFKCRDACVTGIRN